jgi:8-oxo-dGTP diphosphatase
VRPDDALAHLPVPARRVAYRGAYRVLQVWRRVRKPRTDGVKCVLRHEGRVLLVRHTYGDRRLWEFPGGGIRKGEEPLAAARREAREELGVDLDWQPLSTLKVRDRGGLAVMQVVVADARTDAVSIDPGELAEARWASPDDPPRPLSQSTAEILKRL